MLNFLTNIIDSLNPFSENFILKNVLSFLANLLNWLNPFSNDFFGYKIIDLLGNLLKNLFVPSEERITALTNTVSSKFGFVDSIKNAITSLQNVINNLSNAPKLNIDIGATKYNNATTVVIDFGWYSQFKSYGDLIITGFVYVAFLWRLFIKLPGIISGTSGIVDITDSHITIMSKRGGNK